MDAKMYFLIVATVLTAVANQMVTAEEAVRPDTAEAQKDTAEIVKPSELDTASIKPEDDLLSPPPNLDGMETKRIVFHQRHKLKNNLLAGVYGYYDYNDLFHMANYVQDQSGIRLVGDHVPQFHGIGQSGVNEAEVTSEALDTSDGKETGQIAIGGKVSEKQTEQAETMQVGEHKKQTGQGITWDDDPLLQNEHTVIRTHTLPPPQGIHGIALRPEHHRNTEAYHYGYHESGAGNNFRETPLIPGGNRVAYPYENPLYPLLYLDREINRETDETKGSKADEEINDTSGLSAADGVSEVTSKYDRHENYPRRPLPLGQQLDAGHSQIASHHTTGSSLGHRGGFYQHNRYYTHPSRYQASSYGQGGFYGAPNNYLGDHQQHQYRGQYGTYGAQSGAQYGAQSAAVVHPGQQYQIYRYQHVYPMRSYYYRY